MESLVHKCKKQPSNAILDSVVRDEAGEWWLMRLIVKGGILARTENSKVRKLTTGRCPWCKANLAWLSKVWPHVCPNMGQGAKKLVVKSSDLPVVDLQIDPDRPTQAIYTVTYKFTVNKCPDCGTKLFEE